MNKGKRILEANLIKSLLSLKLIPRMISLLWSTQPSLLCGLIISQLVLGLIPSGNAIINKNLFDFLADQSSKHFSGYQIPPHLILILLTQVFLDLFNKGFNLVVGFLNSEVNRFLSYHAQSLVLQKINDLEGLSIFEDSNFYDKIQLGTQSAKSAPYQAFNALLGLLSSLVCLSSLFIVIATIKPLMIIIVLIIALPQFYFQTKIGYQRYKMASNLNPTQRKIVYFNSILSSAQYAKEVRLLNLGKYFLSEFQKLTKTVMISQKQQQLKEIRYQIGLQTLTSIVSNIFYAYIAVRTVVGLNSIGDFSLIISSVAGVQGALLGIVSSLSNINECSLSYTRFIEILEMKQPISVINAPQDVPFLSQGIEFKNVSFRYNEYQPWVLRNVNFYIPANKITALVGVNGSGKTTLTKLLMRFYDPCEGQILWDGMDIRNFDPKVFRSHIGAVFQDFIHFDLTAQENIGFGDISSLHELNNIIYASKLAGIHDVIKNLPYGYQTILSRWLTDEQIGTDLSGGEWQKVAIARMFMRPSEMFILDEPTSALDPGSEYDVYSKFIQLVKTKTSILISHRLGIIKLAENIVVLENGLVKEKGSHNELIRLGGTYSKLYDLQAGYYR